MNHAALKGVLQSFRGLLDGLAGESARQWPFGLHKLSQIDSLDEFHDQEMGSPACSAS